MPERARTDHRGDPPAAAADNRPGRSQPVGAGLAIRSGLRAGKAAAYQQVQLADALPGAFNRIASFVGAPAAMATTATG